MVDTYFNIDPYLDAIASRQLILTANNRLRNHMLRAYGQWQATKGCSVWPSPRIFSLSQWLDQQWQLLQRRAYGPAAKQIVNNAQRQLLWQKIIAESSLAAALLQAEPLAQAADGALRNLELWQLDENQVRAAEPMLSPSSNSYCWLTWLGEFRAALSRVNLITQEASHAGVSQAFAEGVLAREPVVYLTGFDDIPPLYHTLLNTSCDQIKNLHSERDSSNLVRTECNNVEQEIRAAALWSKQQLEQQANAMIGIIVPNLGQCRDQVERIFSEVFEPLALMPEQPRYTLPFNFSAGTPLASSAIIAATLELLELQKTSWELEPLCSLLMSPFFGDWEAECVLRSHLVQALRKQARFTFSLSDLRYHCQAIASKLGADEQANQFSNRLLQLENSRRQSAGFHSAQYWCDYFQQHLDHLGWPGTRRLDSQEHQQLNLWHQTLEEFAQLDSLGLTFSYRNAIQQLRTLAGKTPFQAQTPNSPIQILGALEGAGLQFSHCWVLGLQHRQWPPVPAPNPLLPIHLQRDKKMPHASAERELEFARALTQHYRQCAPQVVFSSAQHDDDSELRASPLIRQIPLTPLSTLLTDQLLCTLSDTNYAALSQSQMLELVHCAQAPAVDLALEPVRGGASLFKEQAACPFNAFARLRLGATRVDPPQPGFSAIERGNLLHETLAKLWRQLKTQSQLMALEPEQLHQLIVSACEETVARLKQKRGISIGSYYAQLEQERLSSLLQDWLTLEKSRPAFNVRTIEQEELVSFAGLPLRLRIDRVDQLDSGEWLLIDYKTGQPKLHSWFGERMDEPQLPLYAVTAQHPVDAIAFAQINAKAMAWIGTGELSLNHDGIAPSKQPWQEQVQEWRFQLDQLAQGFIEGDARVDMKNPTSAQYAEDLLPLNRLLESDALSSFIARQQEVKHD